jgi:hypothetical protein
MNETTDNGVLVEIIDEITAELDELSEEEKTDYNNGQMLAYANALGIIKTCLSGYDLKEFGLDYDIDKKYLL